MKKSIVFVLALLISTQMLGENLEAGSLRRNIATVVFVGLGGAVLGLSTLSFYGEPQEHVNNITTGFLVGLIGGSIYVAADSTKEQMATQVWPTNPSQVSLKVPLIWKTSWSF